MPTRLELVNLLEFPNETLTVEFKSWLTLDDNRNKAKLAKAAIALANHGGGIIVLGMRENNDDGAALVSQPVPDGLGRYSQDEVNSAINRYADPRIHCDLLFAVHPVSQIEHAFVCVPGGLTVPVMSRRGSDGIIADRGCYIRKPGPLSEQPRTVEDWRDLIERCVSARREDMLDAIRLIVQGHSGTAVDENLRNELSDFVLEAQQRWRVLIDPLPQDDAARMQHGHSEIAVDILNVDRAATLAELRRRLDDADRIKLTGWGPFVSLRGEALTPYIFDEFVETWLGNPEGGIHNRTPSYCDFWRAHPVGRLYVQRAYLEDEIEQITAGTRIEITYPIRRVGEAMLYVARLARSFDDNPNIFARVRYTELRNRVLTSINRTHLMFDDRICRDDEATIETTATAREIDENTAEILHPMLVPMYERFSFFELPMSLVVTVVEELKRTRF